MKRFIYLIVVFATAVIVFFLAADIGISTFYRRCYQSLWGNQNADVVIMGNSRAQFHFSPIVLDSLLQTNTYNLGKNGVQIEWQLERYNMYCEYNRKPKYIVQNIDFMRTLGKTTSPHDIYNPYMHKRTTTSICKEKHSWHDYLPFKHCFRFFSLLKEIKNDRNNRKGFLGRNKTWDSRALNQIDSVYFDYDESVGELFAEYVGSVKSQGIGMILVYSPFYIEGIEKVKKDELAHCYTFFDSVAQKYDVPVLDYMHCSLSYDSTYFYNASHLNANGAELFSAMLARDLDSLGLIRKPERNRYFYFRKSE